MIVVAIIAIVLVLAVVGMIAFGKRLPLTHAAACEARINAPPEAVWTALADLEGMPAWRKDLKRVERLPDRDGRPAWIEDGKFGRITYTLEEERPPALRVVRIADDTLPFGGTWTFSLVVENGGTSLTVTEHGEIRPPLLRFLTRYAFGYYSTLEGYLRALGHKFGHDVAVARVQPRTVRAA